MFVNNRRLCDEHVVDGDTVQLQINIFMYSTFVPPLFTNFLPQQNDNTIHLYKFSVPYTAAVTVLICQSYTVVFQCWKSIILKFVENVLNISMQICDEK